MNKRLGLLAIAGLATLVLAVACTTKETVQVLPGGGQAQGISVTGTGEASGGPDLALLTLGVSSEEKSVKEAREKAAGAMEAVLKSLKDKGVEEKDIQTRQLSIEPQFDYGDGRQELRGFRVTNIVSAKLRDLDKVGEVIDGAAEAGGDLIQVQGLSFTIEEPDDLRAQAREEAVNEARAKAERLAELAGVKLGKPISISEEGFFQPPMPFAAAPLAREAEAVETPIQPGELEVSVSVSVLFAIE